MPQNVKHILAIRLSAIGDVVIAATSIRAFTQEYPDIKITFLSKPFAKPLFKDIPNVSFYEIDIKGKHKGIFGIYRLYRELKRLDIDLIADLHNVIRSKLLRIFFWNVKSASYDKGRIEKRRLTRPNNKVFKRLRQSHERSADVFRTLGYPLDLSKSSFPKLRPLTPEIAELITYEPSQTTKYIGIAPFSKHKSKEYPLDLMELVVQQLSQKRDFKVLLFGGGQSEIEKLTSLAQSSQNVICVAGKIKLDQELLLISHLDCMLSMDSGNGHFSAFYGVPTVTLWGSTHPYTGFIPFKQSMENSLTPDLNKYPKLPSSIYGNKTFKGYENAMRTIKPDNVVKKILELVT